MSRLYETRSLIVKKMIQGSKLESSLGGAKCDNALKHTGSLELRTSERAVLIARGHVLGVLAT